jgi:hypothetical protein
MKSLNDNDFCAHVSGLFSYVCIGVTALLMCSKLISALLSLSGKQAIPSQTESKQSLASLISCFFLLLVVIRLASRQGSNNCFKMF